MSSYFLKIEKIYNNISILIQKKKVKNVHLKVYRDLTVKCTFPESASEEYIDKFFKTRIDWINKQLLKYKEATGADNYECLKDGSSFQILGKDLRVFIKQDKHYAVIESEKSIIIYTKDTTAENKIKNQFMIWWREKAQKIFGDILDEIYQSVIKKYNIGKPTLKIREMKTMWGSYNNTSKTINLNTYLLKANILLIQYVVLHELAHTLYKYHNEDFINFLTIHMPDWRERKKILDTQVAQGIS